MKPAFIRTGIENLRIPLQVPTDDAGPHDHARRNQTATLSY
jgi:hypothetical protein